MQGCKVRGQRSGYSGSSPCLLPGFPLAGCGQKLMLVLLCHSPPVVTGTTGRGKVTSQGLTGHGIGQCLARYLELKSTRHCSRVIQNGAETDQPPGFPGWHRQGQGTGLQWCTQQNPCLSSLRGAAFKWGQLVSQQTVQYIRCCGEAQR